MKINEKYPITILIVLLPLLMALVADDSAWPGTTDELYRVDFTYCQKINKLCGNEALANDIDVIHQKVEIYNQTAEKPIIVQITGNRCTQSRFEDKPQCSGTINKPGTTPTSEPGTTQTPGPGTTPTSDPSSTPTNAPVSTPTSGPGTTPTSNPDGNGGTGTGGVSVPIASDDELGSLSCPINIEPLALYIHRPLLDSDLA